MTAESIDSDDSDFYGDAETAQSLQKRVDAFNVEAWRRKQAKHPGHPVKSSSQPRDTSQLHNPYAGVPYAWQLTETVDQFLKRLPPETTTSDEVPWIFICNPYIRRVDKRHSDKIQLKGKLNENEAPDEEGSNVQIVVEAGEERLQLVKSFEAKITLTSKAKTTIERETNKERKQAAADILELAHAYKVRAGKWMLFCSSREVDEVWSIVAKATASNELGIAAKVAPKPEMDDTRKDRLICVYTTDFKDRADVGRVLQKLRELRLVEARGRPIYYKPDAFTYIGIASGNPWGVRPSLYSSQDMFP